MEEIERERERSTMEIRSTWSALYKAAKAGNEAKLNELVSQGVNLDTQIELRNGFHSVLHCLAERGITHGIELLIGMGANIEATCRKRALTALHIAALYGKANVVQTLIDLRATVHARASKRPNGSYNMPLHLVAQYGTDIQSSVQILASLLKHGDASDLLKGDADGDTPLHLAALNSTIPHLMIKELLSILSESSSSGSINQSPTFVVNKKNITGQTPLHFAVGFGNLRATQLLLDAGASKDACDAYGATPFHYAARSGNVGVLDILNVEDVDAPASKNQFRALHYAAWNKRHAAVEWLLRCGASVNVTDTYKGDTPLHLAARRGDAQVIRSLIIRGTADILLTNKKGELALGLVDDRGYHETAKDFVKAIREQNREEGLKDKRSHDGASLLHYFAAYGTEEDMEWILKAIKHNMSALDYKLNPNVVKLDIDQAVNARDSANRNAVHWAAVKGNKHALRILAQNNADLNADMNEQGRHGFPKTPLYLALLNEEKAFADELMKLKSESTALHAQDWLFDICRKWMMAYYEQDAKLKIKLESLRAGIEKHKYPPNIPNDTLFSEIPPIYLALYAEREDIATFIQQHSKGEDDAVNERGKECGRTSLHWATLLGQRKIIAQLCRKVFKDDLTANVEDECGKTALQYAKEMGAKDIEKELMQRSDVRAHIDGLYKDRQVYVDAANSILVGAALIAGVTFAGWLQPPLGYVQSYAAVQQHATVRWFWVFNGLSFSFAIATVLASLVAVVPIRGVYIAASVEHLRQCLLIAAGLLGSSIAFVLVAFALAGFAVLPPLFKYQAIMVGTTIVGAVPCVILFTWFCGTLVLMGAEWLDTNHIWKLLCRNICKGETVETEGAGSGIELCTVPLEAGGPAEIVVDSSAQAGIKEMIDGKLESIAPYQDEDYIFGDSTHQSETVETEGTGSSIELCTVPLEGGPAEIVVDEDYKFDDRYYIRPWLDGLNVSADRL